MKAALDDSGNPVALVFARLGNLDLRERCRSLPLRPPLAPAEGVDPQSVASHLRPAAFDPQRDASSTRSATPHVPVGFWRTVGHSQNPFVRESFIDEIAAASGKDPLEYRRARCCRNRPGTSRYSRRPRRRRAGARRFPPACSAASPRPRATAATPAAVARAVGRQERRGEYPAAGARHRSRATRSTPTTSRRRCRAARCSC